MASTSPATRTWQAQAVTPAIPFKGKLSGDEAVELVRSRVNPKMLDAHRLPMEREWVKNLAFLNGNQHFIEVGGGFRAPILAPHRVMYRANMIRTLVTKMVATVMANSSTFRCPALDWTKKARDNAFVSEKVFEHLRDRVVDWPQLVEDALLWAASCGSGCIEIGWDSEAGTPDRLYYDEGGNLVSGLSMDQKRVLEEQGRFEDVPTGEIFGLSRSMFQVGWDWTCRTDFQDARCGWGATKELVDIEQIENVWGYEKARHVKPVEPTSQSLWYDEMLAFMAGMANSITPGFAAPKDKQRKRALLTRYWERPNRRNNFEGRFIVTAGDVALVNGKNTAIKATGGEFPIPLIKINWQRRPGSFIGHSAVEDLRNPQFQYNNARAKQTEVANVHSHPPIIIDKRSGLPHGEMALEAGVTYEADVAACGGKPIIMGPVPTIPKELAESANRAMQEMHMIASQADPDMSALPGQIRGAPALGMMVEEKNKALLPAAKSALRATVTAGRMMLQIAKHNYTSRRIVRYVGEDNAYRVLAFDAADIVTDLRVTGEPEFFKTKATERAQMVEYVQTGVLDPINNPEDKTTVLKVLAFGNAEEAIAERLADEDNQDREWEDMTSDPLRYLTQNDMGQQMLHYPTQPFDDDAIHERVMRRRMKSGEWRQLDPVSRQLLLQHYQEHVQKIQMAVQQQMQMQAGQAQGGSKAATRGQPSRPKPTAKQGA